MSHFRENAGVPVSPDRKEPDLSAPYDAKEPDDGTLLQEGEPSTSHATESGRPAGDPRALLAMRLLAAAALLVTAIIHARLAFQLGLGGLPFGRGQIVLLTALASAILAIAILSRNSRVWPLAVVLSGAGLLGILASVYFPVASVGTFPAIDEPIWLLTKAVCALAELTVIAIWLIRQIAPARPSRWSNRVVSEHPW